MARRVRAFSRETRLRIARVSAGAEAYYRAQGRQFPWRDERNPYRLAVAEILLQKTRAESVMPVFLDMIDEYPTAKVLAGSSLEKIEVRLRPLGLSRKRSEQLLGMAAAVTERGTRILSDWKTALASVPGLGAYGARATACFGSGKRVGIVDANVARILRRVFRIQTRDPRAIIYQRYADAIAEFSEAVRDTNFGLLDIGAAVCLQRPICERCPFRDFCPRYGVKARS